MTPDEPEDAVERLAGRIGRALSIVVTVLLIYIVGAQLRFW